MDGQIVGRDYLLIDQSEIVCIYLPSHNGRPVVSAGSQSELTYAVQRGREVLVFSEAPITAVSPFIGHQAKVFTSLEDLESELTKRYSTQQH